MKKDKTLHFSYTGCITKLLLLACIFSVSNLSAQSVVDKIIQEENSHSQLQTLAHELFDKIADYGYESLTLSEKELLKKYTK